MKKIIYAFLFVPTLAFSYQPTMLIDNEQKEIVCLTRNVFFEADNQGVLGQRAVAWVTMNRVKYDGWLSDVCGVVYQPSLDPKRPYGCQFSWTCAKHKRIIKVEENILYDKIGIIAYKIYSGHDTLDITNGATYYVRCDIVSMQNFLKDAIFTVRIKDHCFFKDKKRRPIGRLFHLWILFLF